MAKEILLDRYKLIEEIGEGGMATVYRGMDTVLDREVAIKILHSHLHKKPESRERFLREAKATARLKHKNIMQIYDYSGDRADESFLVVEFIKGVPLSKYLHTHAFEVPEVGLMIVRDVVSALEHAHSLGIIHRDIKPENVMIRDDGVVKLTDFGIAYIKEFEKMTMTDSLIGSPLYMSPEHIEGKALDARADLFSTGVMLYELTTGELPFQAASAPALLKRILDGVYRPPSSVNPRIGDRLARIIDKALARDVNERYQHASEMTRDIDAYLQELELGDVEPILANVVTNPEATQDHLRRTVLERLLTLGSSALETKELSRALDCYNQVLAYDERNEEALAKVSGIYRKGRRTTTIRVVVYSILALLGLGVIAFAAWQHLPDLDRDTPPQRAVTRLGEDLSKGLIPLAYTTQKGDEIPLTPQGEPRLFIEPEVRLPTWQAHRPIETTFVKKAKKINKVTPPSAVTYPFTFIGNPPNTRIYLDNVLLGKSPASADLGPGTHTVRLHHPTCKVCKDTIKTLVIDPDSPPKKPSTFRISIGFEPATLMVVPKKSTYKGTVHIANVMKGKLGDAIIIPVKTNKPTPILVKIILEGAGPMLRQVKVSPGQTTTLTVP